VAFWILVDYFLLPCPLLKSGTSLYDDMLSPLEADPPIMTSIYFSTDLRAEGRAHTAF
ncbi:hypothetical protein GW17_00060518, partial [Ensete ventricosum]